MRIAIVGSRHFPEQGLSLVVDFVNKMEPGTVLVSGGAMGVDLVAQRAAIMRGIKTDIYLPDYATHGDRAPLVRNRLIAANCDRMIAFWDGHSTGTRHVIECAKRLGKPVQVVFPTGMPKEVTPRTIEVVPPVKLGE